MQPHVLPGYFDAEAAAIIERAFAAKGVRAAHGRGRRRVAPQGEGCRRDAGRRRGAATADLLLVGAGVAPVTDFLAGTGVDVDRGVLVDDTMRTSVANIWAAGDVRAGARLLRRRHDRSTASCPTPSSRAASPAWRWRATRALKPYPGGVPLNTYTFFGQHAVSVGVHGDGIAAARK